MIMTDHKKLAEENLEEALRARFNADASNYIGMAQVHALLYLTEVLQGKQE